MKLMLILGIVVAVLLLGALTYGAYFFYMVKFRTKTATPNQALLITGKNLGNDALKNDKGNYVKIVRGGLVRLGFQQHADVINLNSFQLKLSVNDIMVQGEDTVNAEATALISVGDTNEHVLAYAEQFMGKSQEVIETEIREIMVTHLRSILTTLTVEQINSKRKDFNDQVQEIAQQDLNALGFKISSFGLGKLEDSDKEGGYLSNAEKKRKAAMKKEADIATSEAERETRIKMAEDEKIAKEIENERAVEVAESDKIRKLKEDAIRKETEKARAEAEVAYDLEKVKQSKQVIEEETKARELQQVAERKLAVIRAEEENEVALLKADREVQEEAKRQERLKVENNAKAEIDVRKAQADAEVALAKASADSEAEIKRAQAESEKKRLDNEVEIERIEKTGKAEADAILAKGQAEATIEKALSEIKISTAEIYLQEKAIAITPEVASALAQAIGAIESVKVFQTGTDGGDATSSVTNSVLANIGTTHEIIKEVTGVDMAKIALNKSNQPQVNVDLAESK